MSKLDKLEIGIIVVSVWVAAFLSSLMITQDGWRSLGSSIWFILLGFAVVGTINKRREKLTKTSQ